MQTDPMQRQGSSSSLHNLLLDRSPDIADLDSCCTDGDDDVFDPPAWRPGRFLQFADIDLTAEDEPSIRPVSLPTERLGPHGRCVAWERLESVPPLGGSTASWSGSFVVQVDSDRLLCVRHWKPLMSRRTLVLLTSCTTVALTALTLLSFVLQ